MLLRWSHQECITKTKSLILTVLIVCFSRAGLLSSVFGMQPVMVTMGERPVLGRQVNTIDLRPARAFKNCYFSPIQCVLMDKSAWQNQSMYSNITNISKLKVQRNLLCAKKRVRTCGIFRVSDTHTFYQSLSEHHWYLANVWLGNEQESYLKIQVNSWRQYIGNISIAIHSVPQAPYLLGNWME
jgi:hypothetical protein